MSNTPSAEAEAQKIVEWLRECGYIDDEWIIEQHALASGKGSGSEAVDRVCVGIADRITAALLRGPVNEACPCLHTEPCQPNCTCVKPFMSHGCMLCCTYGSKEQQRANAERIKKAVLRRPDEKGETDG